VHNTDDALHFKVDPGRLQQGHLRISQRMLVNPVMASPAQWGVAWP
jgi:hypothetical protein